MNDPLITNPVFNAIGYVLSLLPSKECHTYIYQAYSYIHAQLLLLIKTLCAHKTLSLS